MFDFLWGSEEKTDIIYYSLEEILQACEKGEFPANLIKAVSSLSVTNEDLLAKTENGYTLLHALADRGVDALSGWMPALKCYIDSKDSRGRSPLSIACTETKNVSLINTLLAHKARYVDSEIVIKALSTQTCSIEETINLSLLRRANLNEVVFQQPTAIWNICSEVDSLSCEQIVFLLSKPELSWHQERQGATAAGLLLERYFPPFAPDYYKRFGSEETFKDQVINIMAYRQHYWDLFSLLLQERSNVIYKQVNGRWSSLLQCAIDLEAYAVVQAISSHPTTKLITNKGWNHEYSWKAMWLREDKRGRSPIRLALEQNNSTLLDYFFKLALYPDLCSNHRELTSLVTMLFSSSTMSGEKDHSGGFDLSVAIEMLSQNAESCCYEQQRVNLLFGRLNAEMTVHGAHDWLHSMVSSQNLTLQQGVALLRCHHLPWHHDNTESQTPLGLLLAQDPKTKPYYSSYQKLSSQREAIWSLIMTPDADLNTQWLQPNQYGKTPLDLAIQSENTLGIETFLTTVFYPMIQGDPSGLAINNVYKQLFKALGFELAQANATLSAALRYEGKPVIPAYAINFIKRLQKTPTDSQGRNWLQLACEQEEILSPQALFILLSGLNQPWLEELWHQKDKNGQTAFSVLLSKDGQLAQHGAAYLAVKDAHQREMASQVIQQLAKKPKQNNNVLHYVIEEKFSDIPLDYFNEQEGCKNYWLEQNQQGLSPLGMAINTRNDETINIFIQQVFQPIFQRGDPREITDLVVKVLRTSLPSVQLNLNISSALYGDGTTSSIFSFFKKLTSSHDTVPDKDWPSHMLFQACRLQPNEIALAANFVLREAPNNGHENNTILLEALSHLPDKEAPYYDLYRELKGVRKEVWEFIKCFASFDFNVRDPVQEQKLLELMQTITKQRKGHLLWACRNAHGVTPLGLVIECQHNKLQQHFIETVALPKVKKGIKNDLPADNQNLVIKKISSHYIQLYSRTIGEYLSPSLWPPTPAGLEEYRDFDKYAFNGLLDKLARGILNAKAPLRKNLLRYLIYLESDSGWQPPYVTLMHLAAELGRFDLLNDVHKIYSFAGLSYVKNSQGKYPLEVARNDRSRRVLRRNQLDDYKRLFTNKPLCVQERDLFLLERLDLQSAGLDDSEFVELVRCFSIARAKNGVDMPLTQLNLSNNNIGHAGLVALTTFMEENLQELSFLDLSNNEALGRKQTLLPFYGNSVAWLVKYKRGLLTRVEIDLTSIELGDQDIHTIIIVLNTDSKKIKPLHLIERDFYLTPPNDTRSNERLDKLRKALARAAHKECYAYPPKTLTRMQVFYSKYEKIEFKPRKISYQDVVLQWVFEELKADITANRFLLIPLCLIEVDDTLAPSVVTTSADNPIQNPLPAGNPSEITPYETTAIRKMQVVLLFNEAQGKKLLCDIQVERFDDPSTPEVKYFILSGRQYDQERIMEDMGEVRQEQILKLLVKSQVLPSGVNIIWQDSNAHDLSVNVDSHMVAIQGKCAGQSFLESEGLKRPIDIAYQFAMLTCLNLRGLDLKQHSRFDRLVSAWFAILEQRSLPLKQLNLAHTGLKREDIKKLTSLFAPDSSELESLNVANNPVGHAKQSLLNKYRTSGIQYLARWLLQYSKLKILNIVDTGIDAVDLVTLVAMSENRYHPLAVHLYLADLSHDDRELWLENQRRQQRRQDFLTHDGEIHFIWQQYCVESINKTPRVHEEKYQDEEDLEEKYSRHNNASSSFEESKNNLTILYQRLRKLVGDVADAFITQSEKLDVLTRHSENNTTSESRHLSWFQEQATKLKESLAALPSETSKDDCLSNFIKLRDAYYCFAWTMHEEGLPKPLAELSFVFTQLSSKFDLIGTFNPESKSEKMEQPDTPKKAFVRGFNHAMGKYCNASDILHSGIIADDAIQPLQRYERMRDSFKKMLFAALLGVPAIGAIGHAAAHGVKFFGVLHELALMQEAAHASELGEALTEFFENIPGLEHVVEHIKKAPSKGIDAITKQLIGKKLLGTKTRLDNFFKSFVNNQDRENKIKSVINALVKTYESLFCQLSNEEALLLGDLCGAHLSEGIMLNLFRGKDGGTLDWEVFRDLALYWILYKPMPNPKILNNRHFGRISTDTLLRGMGLKCYRRGSEEAILLKIAKAEIVPGDGLKPYVLSSASYDYPERSGSFGYRLMQNFEVEMIQALLSSSESIPDVGVEGGRQYFTKMLAVKANLHFESLQAHQNYSIQVFPNSWLPQSIQLQLQQERIQILEEVVKANEVKIEEQEGVISEMNERVSHLEMVFRDFEVRQHASFIGNQLHQANVAVEPAGALRNAVDLVQPQGLPEVEGEEPRGRDNNLLAQARENAGFFENANSVSHASPDDELTQQLQI